MTPAAGLSETVGSSMEPVASACILSETKRSGDGARALARWTVKLQPGNRNVSLAEG